jgi:hypothetical protein
VYHLTWAHLSSVLLNSLPSVYLPVSVIWILLLGNGSVKTNTQATI